MEEQTDKINPSHYKPTGDPAVLDRMIRLGDLQVIDVIELFDLGYHLGNVAKYVLRSGKKPELGYEMEMKEIEDLEKGVWYLQRKIKVLKDSMEAAELTWAA